MPVTRVRVTVSVAPSTIATLDAVVAEGQADTRSSAVDIVAATWQRMRRDVDLVAAAEDADTSGEADLDGVVRADQQSDRAMGWSSLSQ